MYKNLDQVISEKLELLEFKGQKARGSVTPSSQKRNVLFTITDYVWKKNRGDRRGGGVLIVMQSVVKLMRWNMQRGKQKL